MNRVVFLAAAMLIPFASANAASQQYTAKLAQPVAQAKEVVAGNAVWECSQSACVAQSSSHAVGSVLACRDLARQVGEVSAYGTDAAPLDAAHLAECNQH
jgi:hypothetical protein